VAQTCTAGPLCSVGVAGGFVGLFIGLPILIVGFAVRVSRVQATGRGIATSGPFNPVGQLGPYQQPGQPGPFDPYQQPGQPSPFGSYQQQDPPGPFGPYQPAGQ
jgi:hypothetical protein